MVKLVLSNEKMVTLKKGNKTIIRSELDYETNKSVWDFRGFKPEQDVVKETKVEQPKKKKVVRKKKMYKWIWKKIRKNWKWLYRKTWNNLLFIAPILTIILFLIYWGK